MTVEFEDKGYTFDPVSGTLISDNDAAELESVQFDLVVYAVQVTTNPNP